ncbi:MAG: molybdopterin guanine dinucleotide-containing S/N-oxide reductase [Pseudomonadota bacterium]
MTSSHFGSFTAHVKGGKFVSVTPFSKDPDPTPMIEVLNDWVYSKSRVHAPSVRKGFLENGHKSDRSRRGAEPFVEVSWDKALDLVASELKRVKESHGNQAIFGGPNGWRQAGMLHDPQVLLKRFLAGFGGYTGDNGGYSWGASKAILPHILGDQNARVGKLTTYKSIAENTKLLVLWGTTPLKNGQIMRNGGGAHTTRGYMDSIRKAGVEVVVINPVADEEVDFFKAQWIKPRPNTDTAMMLGMMHTLHTEGLYDKDFLANYTVGFAKFEEYLLGKTDGQPKSADWAAGLCDVDAQAIRDLARRMAKTRSFIMMGPAMQRSDHGGYVYWMQIVLSAMLGQIGLPGGGFGYGYGYYAGFGQPISGVAVPGTGTGKNPVKVKIPTAKVADMLLNPGKTIDWNGKKVTYPDIKLVYWAGGNAIVHHQDINNMLQAWQRPETIIYHEPWWTPSAKFSDIVLPATSPLERNDIARRTGADNYIMTMQQAIPPVGQARNDYDILADLAERLGFRDQFTEGRSEMDWLRHMYAGAQEQAQKKNLPMPDFDAFWEKGFVEFPEENVDNILYGSFRKDPNANPLGTPSGKIEIFSPVIAQFGYADSPPFPQWIEPYEWLGDDEATAKSLHLLSSHPANRLHSQLNQTKLREKYTVQGREPVWMSPADAEKRGIKDGDLVRVFNKRGQVLAGAKVTDRVRPGVIRMDEGAWYDPAEPGKPGSLCKYGCNNVLSMDRGTSSIGQGSSVKTTLAEVEKYTGPGMTVTAFDPPRIVR